MKRSTSYLISLLRLLKNHFNPKRLQGIQIKRRGRPFTYSTRAMLALFLVMMLKGIRSFKRVHKFLKEHPAIRRYCGFEKVPHRSTLSRRLRAFFCDILKGRSYIWEPKLEKTSRRTVMREPY